MKTKSFARTWGLFSLVSCLIPTFARAERPVELKIDKIKRLDKLPKDIELDVDPSLQIPELKKLIDLGLVNVKDIVKIEGGAQDWSKRAD